MQSTEGPRIARLPQRKTRTETSDLERYASLVSTLFFKVCYNKAVNVFLKIQGRETEEKDLGITISLLSVINEIVVDKGIC